MIFALYLATWLLGGLLIGLTSFGGNLLTVPVTAILYTPKCAVVTGCLAGSLMCLALACIYRRHILWRDVWMLDLGCMAGVWPGVWILEHASERTLLLGCAASIFLFLLARHIMGAENRKRDYGRDKWLALFFGVLSGIMTGSIGISGVAMGIYALAVDMRKECALATLNAAGTFVLLAGLPFQYMAGFLPAETATLGIYGGIASIAGVMLSVPLIKRMSQSVFSRIVLAMLVMSALMLVVRGIW